MPSSPADLMQQVADFLQGVYAGGASTPAQGSVLAFEQLGFPVSPDDFRTDRADPKSPLSPELGLYQTSKYSDFIPTIIGASTLVPSVRTLEEQYSELLGGSQAVSGADVTAFGAVKSPAREFFDNTPRPRPDVSATQYHAAEPTPTDWYDATILTNWTNHTLTTGQDPAAPSAGGASPPPTPQGPVPAPPLLVWHVLPEQPVASRSRFQFAGAPGDRH